MLPIQKAVDKVGGQTALANICSVKQQAVWNWINREKQPLGKYCLLIEQSTCSSVTRYELRTDLFGPKP